jgi:predicted thioesterase
LMMILVAINVARGLAALGGQGKERHGGATRMLNGALRGWVAFGSPFRPSDMAARIHSGLAGTLQFKVEPQHLIDFAGADMPAVLSTPWLIKWLEQTARETLRPLLADGEASVGMEVDVRHLAPTPLGATVTCTARVISAEAHTVTFQIEAVDGVELIMRGTHRRAVILKERFHRRVQAKNAMLFG